jgi:competence protein ComEC
MLLDGGMAKEGTYDAGKRILAPYLWKRRIMRIDYLIVSHPQSDHYGGLAYVADNFKIKEVWTGPIMGDEEEDFKCFLALCERKGICHRVFHADMDPIVMEGTTIHILNPVLSDNREGIHSRTSEYDDSNNRSLVLQLVHKKVLFLFTGDIESEAETRLVTYYGDLLGSTVLNVPHHGSSTSSTYGFLTTVYPCIAVVSAGFENRFGFPAKVVLDRYMDIGIRLFRTDLDGAVQISSNGRDLITKTFAGSAEEETLRTGGMYDKN